MKLSEILNSYYVIPYNGSEIIGFHEDADNADELPLLVISWRDSQDWGEEYIQEFEDQEITPDPNVPGGFLVTTIDDADPVGFIALQGVDLIGGNHEAQ